jgi:predicted nucleic acid-binding protein
MGERRKRLSYELIQTFLADLECLPVMFHTTQDLCRKHGLTAYDAAYLESAMRHRIALATVDAVLERAARAERIEIV